MFGHEPAPARQLSCALVLAVISHSGVCSAQQTYLPPENPARSELSVDNPFAGGQPSDLKFEVEDVTFEGDLCPSATSGVLKGAKVKIKVGWKTSQGFFGLDSLQAEGSATTDGDDSIVFEIGGRGRWVLESVTRDSEDVLGGAEPEGETGGDGSFDGVNITPPSEFESGQYAGGSPNANELTYVLSLKYTPLPGDGCECVGFLIRGRYLHTYDGPFEVMADNSLFVGASFPWPLKGSSIGAGMTFVFTNDHAWSKQLINGGGESDVHIDDIETPPFWVPKEECCPTGSSTTTDTSLNTTVTIPTSDALAFIQRCKIVTQYVLEPLLYWVQVVVRGPNGVEIGRFSQLFNGLCDEECTVDVPFTIPAGYVGESFSVEVVAYSGLGGAAIGGSSSVFYPTVQVPKFESTSLNGLGVASETDTLLVQLADGTLSGPALAANASVSVVSATGTLMDQETPAWSGSSEWELVIPMVARSAPATSGDGVLSTSKGDTVLVTYDTGNATLVGSIDIIRAPDLVSPSLASQQAGTSSKVIGAAQSDNSVKLEIQFVGRPLTLVTVPVTAGMSAATVSAKILATLRAQGAQASVLPDGSIRCTGPTSLRRCRLLITDPGLDVTPSN